MTTLIFSPIQKNNNCHHFQQQHQRGHNGINLVSDLSQLGGESQPRQLRNEITNLTFCRQKDNFYPSHGVRFVQESVGGLKFSFVTGNCAQIGGIYRGISIQILEVLPIYHGKVSGDISRDKYQTGGISTDKYQMEGIFTEISIRQVSPIRSHSQRGITLDRLFKNLQVNAMHNMHCICQSV